ncbi:MAG: peptidase [Aquabacterium sp.]|nr:peptidase [Aquabacterium sp.]
MNTKKSLLAAGLVSLALTAPALAANIILNNVDAPGIGFNDTTPAAPVGGNMGTTVGAQRLIAYQRALELWGKTLRSNATIVVRGSFARLDCARGVLASAGALQIFSDFPGATLTGHWYGSALANSLAGQDLTPGPLDVPGPDDQSNDDIQANFNGDVGKADCLPGPGWYYGLDNTPVIPGQIDFLDTFMHEVAHGLGFQNFVREDNGSMPAGLPDVYMANTLDLTLGKRWNAMTVPEVKFSAINTGKVVWAGPRVTSSAPLVLGPYQGVRLFGGVNKEIVYGAASFGAPASAATLNGSIVVGLDGAGASSTDACEPLTNAVSGKVVLVDRGNCTFAVKATNAQAAGASALVIANIPTAADPTAGAFGPGGSAPAVTISVIGISQANGNEVKTALAVPTAVGIEYFVDPTRLAGATDGLVRLYAPSAVALGSSISHFDTVASPNLLMEPAINGDLRSATNLDLTPALMQDVGWQLETLKIGACDSGVPATLATGQLLHVNVEQCAAGAKNHGQFVSCMTGVTNAAKAKGLLSGAQQGAVMSCAGRGRP